MLGARTLSHCATFYADSPEISFALRRRLEDNYEEARREAIWGLAAGPLVESAALGDELGAGSKMTVCT